MLCFSNKIFIGIFSLIFLSAAFCGGGGNGESHAETENTTAKVPAPALPTLSTASASAAPSAQSSTASSTASTHADDEIVPLLNPIPPPSAKDRDIPEDPAAFRRQLKETLKTGQSTDVLPMLDVVLLLNPQDLEMREARADILLKQGLAEDAAVDLEQCCKGGRPSCCR